jgi:hypothetical protein
MAEPLNVRRPIGHVEEDTNLVPCGQWREGETHRMNPLEAGVFVAAADPD